MRKGIILAGGKGSRLYPLTLPITKQLLPVYDKPMIYYPLSTLLDLNIDNILIIVNERDKAQFKSLLGDGKDLGVKISYKTQNKPNGIAEGLILAEEFLNGSKCVFILGDNLFIGPIAQNSVKQEIFESEGATIFTCTVNDPERYGVVRLNNDNEPIEIKEKPKKYISNHAITGLYFYDENAPNIAKSLKPSKRNELEITDVNKYYLKNKMLKIKKLDDNLTWLDAGTIDSLYEASSLVAAIEKRTGKKIGCIEEICLNNHKINLNQLAIVRSKYGSSDYGKYLDNLINN